MLPERTGERRGERDRGGRERGHHDAAARLGGLRGQVRLGRFDHGEDALGVDGKALARVGEARAPRGSVEQGGARLLFEHRELLRDRARGVAQGFGGPRDRAPRRELVQHAEPADIKHYKILS